MTDSRFGGFEAGSSYRIAIGASGEGHVKWSDLKVQYGYEFLVADMTSGMIADRINGTVTANFTGAKETLAFATNNETDSSEFWEITGTMEQELGGLKQFIIQSADGTKTQSYVMYDGALLIEEGDNYTWYQPDTLPEYVFYNPSYSGMSYTHDPLQFKVVIENDQFTVWLADQPIWSIPLTDSRFGGFEAGSSYRIAIGASGEGHVKWSDLKVEY